MSGRPSWPRWGSGLARRRLPGRLPLLLPLLLLTARPAPGAAEVADLGDLDARIEYAYYAADGRTLDSLVDEARSIAAGSHRWAGYALAHVEFRRAALSAERGDAAAAEAADRCLRAAAPVLAAEDRSVAAEGFNVAAACEGYRRAPSRRAIERSLARARALTDEPPNPRTEYLAALLPGSAASPGAALNFAESAARAFAEPRALNPGQPGWGAPEAWFLVGERAAALGEWLKAREAYERCLVLAPDYRRAAVQMSRLKGDVP